MPEPTARNAAAFVTELRAVLPPTIRLGQADPELAYPILPGEDLPGAVDKRRREFSAGRAAARAALMLSTQALPVGPDRAPVWPEGSVGSITHCAGLCLAIAGNAAAHPGIGLDVEPDIALEFSLWNQILRPDELASDGHAALAHFVAKEACYKAQYALSRQLFGFQTLCLNFFEDRFEATFMTKVPPFPAHHRVKGVMVREGGYLGAFVALNQFR